MDQPSQKEKECFQKQDEYSAVTGRNISALLNPRPVVLVGTYESKANFSTLAWITPLSHEPAMLALAIRPTSYTYEVIQKTNCFSVNILDTQHFEIVHYCGNHSGHKLDKSRDIAFKMQLHLPYKENEDSNEPFEESPRCIPSISTALSVLDCELESSRIVGDHVLILAYVCQALTRCPMNDEGMVYSPATLLCLQRDTLATATSMP